jgi:transcriptional regulator with XRE-family HTH domain
MARNIKRHEFSRSYSVCKYFSHSQLAFSFAYALRVARYAHHHSQTDLSQLLGVRQALISDWENGKSVPDLYRFLHLEKLYGRAYFSRSPDGLFE